MGHRRKSDEAPLSLFSLQDIITSLCGILILLVLLLALHVSANQDKAKDLQSEKESEFDRALDEEKRLEQRQNELSESVRARVEALQNLAGGTVSHIQLEEAERTKMRDYESDLATCKAEIQRLGTESVALAETLREEARLRSETQKRLDVVQGELEKRRTRLVAILPDDDVLKRPVLVQCSSNRVVVLRLSEPPQFSWPPSEAVEQFRSLTRQLDRWRDYFVFFMKPSGVDVANKLEYWAKRAGYDVGYDALEEDETLVRETP
jgi:hypothetical protein